MSRKEELEKLVAVLHNYVSGGTESWNAVKKQLAVTNAAPSTEDDYQKLGRLMGEVLKRLHLVDPKSTTNRIADLIFYTGIKGSSVVEAIAVAQNYLSTHPAPVPKPALSLEQAMLKVLSAKCTCSAGWLTIPHYENCAVTLARNEAEKALKASNEAFAMGPVMSSVFKEAGYKGNTLRLHFHNGSTWDYFGVPYSVFKRLLEASSMGRYYNDNIKGIYDSLQVS